MHSKIFCGILDTFAYNDITSKEEEYGIKLYKIEILKYQELVSSLRDLLSVSERNRADRYHFIKDKNKFIICRAMLKLLLAKYVRWDINKISIDSDYNNKPYLTSHPSVFFNLSHAGDLGIIAIGKIPLGVDIEFIDSKFDFTEISTTVFNELEINHIHNSDNKSYSFYKFWTRKEAIVKAIGKGIDDDIYKIPATDGLHSVSSLLLSDFKKISVLSFDVTPEYLAAIALTENLDNTDNNWNEKIKFYPLPESDELMNFIKTT